MTKATEACEAVEWVPSVHCPRCGSSRVEVRRTMPTERGDAARVRYHRCRDPYCQALFKSVEVLAQPRAG